MLTSEVAPESEKLAASDVSQAEAGTQASSPVNDAWGVRRQFFLPVIAPGLLMGKANMIVTPMLPILIRVDLGGSVGNVTLITMAVAFGSLVAAVPVGNLLAKMSHGLGSCSALVCLSLLSVATFFVCDLVTLGILRFLNGVVTCAWDVSQKTWISAEVPKAVRGRIASTMAGCNKSAIVIATLLGGLVAQIFSTRSVFLVRAGFTCLALFMLLLHIRFIRRQGAPMSSALSSNFPGDYRRHSVSTDAPMRSRGVLCLCWRDLLGAGLFCSLLGGIRSTWMILLPLKAHEMGLSKINIGCVIAFMRSVEALLTLTSAGRIMDKYGQKASGLPATLLIGLAYGITPMCTNVPLLIASTLLYALGNGLSGGIVVSYSTGLAPSFARSQFLGLWKVIQSVGNLGIPPLFGVVADASGSLETAAMSISGVCAFSALWLLLVARNIPRDMSEQSCTGKGKGKGKAA